MPTINVIPGCDLELQAIADAMANSKKVVVVTGAGISTNCGIPDFRSENGLYSMIQAQYDAALKNPPWEKKDEFDIDDRPSKKRKRWFYEVVKADGTVVDVIDEDTSTTENPAPPACPNPTTFASPKPDSLEIQHCSSPLSSLGSTPSGTPDRSDPDNIAHSNSSTRSQSPADSYQSRSQSSASSSQTSQSEESSQTTRTELPNLKGRDLFDSMVWKDAFTTSIFYMFISTFREKVRKDVKSTTVTHRYIKSLQLSGRLVRNYTQNIDGLEARAGLSTELSLGPGNRARFHAKTTREPRPDVVQPDSNWFGGVESVPLHGTLDQLRCGLCRKVSPWEPSALAFTLAGSAPDCPYCTEYTAARTGRGRRGLAVGRLRPDIVLYGEEHPSANLIGPIVTHDIGLGPDVLLILGTSLKVHGLKIIVKEFANVVHNKGGKVIFVNRTKPPESTWGEVIDYWVCDDCDAWVIDMKERQNRNGIWLSNETMRTPEEVKKLMDSATDSKGKRESSGPIKKKGIPECRDNGVYVTFKILDILGAFRDENGDQASRPMYWGNSATKTTKGGKKRKSLPNGLSLPAAPDTTTSAKANVPAAEYWKTLRHLAPSLPETPPKSKKIHVAKVLAVARKTPSPITWYTNFWTPKDVYELISSMNDRKSSPETQSTLLFRRPSPVMSPQELAVLFQPAKRNITKETASGSETEQMEPASTQTSTPTLPLSNTAQSDGEAKNTSRTRSKTSHNPFCIPPKARSLPPLVLHKTKKPKAFPVSRAPSRAVKEESPAARRRPPPACDLCYIKKCKCDGLGAICSKCVKSNQACTTRGQPNPPKEDVVVGKSDTISTGEIQTAQSSTKRKEPPADSLSILPPVQSAVPIVRKIAHPHGTRASQQGQATTSSNTSETAPKSEYDTRSYQSTNFNNTPMSVAEDISLGLPYNLLLDSAGELSQRVGIDGVADSFGSENSANSSSEVFFDAVDMMG